MRYMILTLLVLGLGCASTPEPCPDDGCAYVKARRCIGKSTDDCMRFDFNDNGVVDTTDADECSRRNQ